MRTICLVLSFRGWDKGMGETRELDGIADVGVYAPRDVHIVRFRVESPFRTKRVIDMCPEMPLRDGMNQNGKSESVPFERGRKKYSLTLNNFRVRVESGVIMAVN